MFDSTVHEMNSWLKEISTEMEHPDRQIAYHALRGVLFALRDRLTVEEAVDLASQMPALVRGVYFEGYKPAGKPLRYRDRDVFLNRVAEELEKAGGANPETAARAVFAVLSQHISGGEIDDVIQMLPEDVRDLWPAAEGRSS